MFKNKLCREWEDKHEKPSHEGKVLAEHIEEVKKNVRNLLSFYSDFPGIFFKVADYLAEYHDYGKLCKAWTLEKKRPPPHSPWSLQWLIDRSEKFEPRADLTCILWYFVLKHHSKLNFLSLREYRPIIDYIRHQIPKLDFKERVNLVDTFGLFKIADILSARNNESFVLKPPSIDEEKVKNVIENSIIPRRWRQQLRLEKVGNVGLLRAYTGWGKTTASLLFFINKQSVRKVFYLLPTITAINKFYSKLSKSFSNDVSKYFYFYDAEISEDQEKLNELFFARNFLTPLIVTTIDQFLLSFLQYSKYPTKRVMFRGAGLIVDEVHLLNPLMLALTTYFLRKYSPLYKLNLLFMSATLPDALSRYLMGELGVSKDNFLDFSKEYYRRRRVMLNFNSRPIEKDVDKIAEYAKKKKKILVIVNTVRKAIEITKILEEYMPRNSMILLHSRFMYRDRQKKEKMIEDKKKDSHILISTQISEVSLDISYDTLFTEVSSLPSMIQRFGRVNRYGRRKKIDHINTYLYEPVVTNEFHYPYSLNEIDLAKKVAKEVEGEKLENEGQLLDVFNSEYSYDDLVEEMNDVNRKVDLEAFEKKLHFFFSLDIEEDKLMRILNYRGSFNALIIPHPSCIGNDNLKERVKNLVFQPLKGMPFGKKRRIIAKIKNVSLPVPMWYLEKEKGVHEDFPYPLVAFENKIYDEYFGLLESDMI